jgi:hypothetical protein
VAELELQQARQVAQAAAEQVTKIIPLPMQEPLIQAQAAALKTELVVQAGTALVALAVQEL